MHGLIFTSFLEFARRELDGVELDGDYRLDRAYPDDEFTALVETAARGSGRHRDDVLRDFGRFAGTTEFARLYPAYYAGAAGTRAFLLAVEERIHALVRATIPDADPPRLHVTPVGDDSVVVGYMSDRGLCPMLEGLIEGVAEHYGERFDLTHAQCMRRGDLECTVLVEPA